MLSSHEKECDPQRAPPSIWRLVSRREQIIVPLTTAKSGIPIFCIHSIGGDLSGYDRLASALGSEYRIYGLQVPKTMMVSDAEVGLGERARRYVDAIMRLQPEGPVVIAGYSAGAVIALEVAQQLQTQGRAVPLLVAFDGAPSNTGAGLKSAQPEYWLRLAYNIPRRLANIRFRDFRLESLRMRLAFRRSVKVQATSTSHRAAEMDAVSRVAERSGWPEEQRVFIRKMYHAMVSYVPRAYNGKVILYEVKAQPFFQLAQFGAAWQKIASTCEIVGVNARHSDFFESKSGLSRVADHLRAAIQKLESLSEESTGQLLPHREQTSRTRRSRPDFNLARSHSMQPSRN